MTTSQATINFYKDEKGKKPQGADLVPSYKDLMDKSKTAKELVENYPNFDFPECFFNVPFGKTTLTNMYKEMCPEKYENNNEPTSKFKRRVSSLLMKAFKNEGNQGFDNNLKITVKDKIQEWNLVEDSNNLAVESDFEKLYSNAIQLATTLIKEDERFVDEKLPSYIAYILRHVCTVVRDYLSSTFIEEEVVKEDVAPKAKDNKKTKSNSILDKIKKLMGDTDVEIDVENVKEVENAVRNLIDVIVERGENIAEAPTTKRVNDNVLNKDEVLVKLEVPSNLEPLLSSLKLPAELIQTVLKEGFVFKEPVEKPSFAIRKSALEYTTLSLIFNAAIKNKENIDKMKSRPYADFTDGKINLRLTEQKFIPYMIHGRC